MSLIPFPSLQYGFPLDALCVSGKKHTFSSDFVVVGNSQSTGLMCTYDLEGNELVMVELFVWWLGGGEDIFL